MMDVITAMKISGSALKAERIRLNVAAMNLANIDTTRTMEGGPYRAKSVVFAAKPLEGTFEDRLSGAADTLRQVEVVKVVEDQTSFREVYDPGNPDADANGIVRLPNVDLTEQMVDSMNARRAYEANVSALDAAKNMALRALDIGR
jgi:flagellar basal-body rod protein FlgC